SYDSCIDLSRAAQDAETVDQCFHAANLKGTNADFDPNAVGLFYYNGGPFQKYADLELKLGADNGGKLLQAVGAQVGLDFAYSCNFPPLADGYAPTPGH